MDFIALLYVWKKYDSGSGDNALYVLDFLSSNFASSKSSTLLDTKKIEYSPKPADKWTFWGGDPTKNFTKMSLYTYFKINSSPSP